MLQCKEQFWQREGITGGFSFTDLPISQLHYPTKLPGDQDTDRGVFMVYTWKQEALLFGSQSKQSAKLWSSLKLVVCNRGMMIQLLREPSVC